MSNLRVVRQRDFGPFLAGNFLSNCGTWFQNLAQSVLIYRLTGSTLLVGVVNFAQFIGMFVLSPWSGGWADRFDRRRVLILTQVGSVAVTGTLALLSATGHATSAVVIALALLLGVASAFAIPTLMALVPLLVSSDDLGPAVALNSVTFTLARGVGPVLGTIVIEKLGISAAFGLNSLSYVALIVALLAVHPRPQALRPPERTRILDAVRIVRDDAKLFALIGVVVAVSLTQDPVSTLTPGFAVKVFHHHDYFTGILIGAFGLGSAVAGLMLAAARRHTVRRLPYTCAVMAIGMIAFALSPSLWVGCACLFVAGLGFMASNTTATTLVQLTVDDQQRGRVMAVWSASFLGVRPFASLVDGGIAQSAGLRTAGLVMAVPALIAAVAAAVRLNRRRQPDLGAPGAAFGPARTQIGEAEVEAGVVEVETQL